MTRHREQSVLVRALVAASIMVLAAGTLLSAKDTPVYTAVNRAAAADTDGDGIPDSRESGLGLDPMNLDTDGNGILDGAEDADRDRLTNAFETNWSHTDPLRPDSDDDGFRDSIEDDDGDGLSSRGEQRFRTDPFVADTDRDGTDDWHEDSDHDGRADGLLQDDRPLPTNLKPSLAAASEDMSFIGTQTCHSRPGQTAPISCTFTYGKAAGRKTVLLIGDSHAVHWFNALRLIAKANGWRLITMTKSICPIADVITYYKGKLNTECTAWHKRAFAKVKAIRPDLVIASSLDSYSFRNPVTGRPTKSAKYWKAGLIRNLTALRAGARQVVLLGDVFFWGSDTPTVIDCLTANPDHVSRCERRRDGKGAQFGLARDRVGRSAAAAADAKFRPTWQISCTYDPCPLVVEDRLVTRDGGHLTSTYAPFLTNALKAILPKP